MRDFYRILVLSKFRNYISYFSHGVIEGAIRNGWRANWVELQKLNDAANYKEHCESILEQIVRYRPHVIFCNGIFGEDSEAFPGIFDVLLKIRKRFDDCKIVYHMGDPRNEPRYRNDISKLVDIALCNFGGELLEKFSDIWKVPCYHWPYACWQFPRYVEKEKRYDLLYLGNVSEHPRYKDRTPFVHYLLDNASMEVRRFPDEEIGNTRFFLEDIVPYARGLLSLAATYDLPYYIDARPFEYLGFGGLVFRPMSAGLTDIFVPFYHFIPFDFIPGEHKYTMKSLEEVYYEYTTVKRDQAEKIRRQGFEYTQNYHNYRMRVRDVILLLEGVIERPLVYLSDFDF